MFSVCVCGLRDRDKWKASSCNKWPIIQRARMVSRCPYGPNVSTREGNSSDRRGQMRG